MKLFCLLVIVGYVAASDPGYTPPSYGGLNIHILEEWTQALEADLKDLAKNISDATTLCEVGDEELNEIYDFFIASMTTKNKQHYDLIASYQDQVKGLQHLVDDAKAKEKEAISLAESTLDSVTDQINNFLNGSGVHEVSEEQQIVIDELNEELSECKQDYLSNLTDTINRLNLRQREAENKIRTVDEFISKRKCEYGFGFLDEGVTKVDFKTRFTTEPTVTMSLTGFVAHLDNYKNKYDVLSLSKQVTAESSEYFSVAAYDDSEGQVDVKYVSCSWMACQYLDRDIDLKHPVAKAVVEADAAAEAAQDAANAARAAAKAANDAVAAHAASVGRAARNATKASAAVGRAARNATKASAAVGRAARNATKASVAAAMAAQEAAKAAQNAAKVVQDAAAARSIQDAAKDIAAARAAWDTAKASGAAAMAAQDAAKAAEDAATAAKAAAAAAEDEAAALAARNAAKAAQAAAKAAEDAAKAAAAAKAVASAKAAAAAS